MTVVAVFPSDVKVVGLCVHRGRALVATSNGVYYVRGDELVPLRLAEV